MLHINKTYIEKNGGLLHSIRKKSNRYINALLKESGCIKPTELENRKLDRTIVHTAPHLDEYFADLMFRSVLPDNKLDITFMEMSIHSKTHDSLCKSYWPNAAVIGLGGSFSGGVKPFLHFDEHMDSGMRSDDSCSQIVINETLYPGIPTSITRLLKEVNEIDEFGKAHDQHIGNIIKTAHVTRLKTNNPNNENDVHRDFMDAEWKKTLMDAMITSIIYCLEHNIDIMEEPKLKDATLRVSFEHYLNYCGYNKKEGFKATVDRIKNIYFNQTMIFKDAKLPRSRKIDQLMIMGRICFALEKCWGEQITKILMMHIWEILYLSQSSFYNISNAIQPFIQNDGKIKTNYGEFIKKTVLANHTTRKNDIWIINVDQNPDFLKGHRAIVNLINKYNNGNGIIIINNNYDCTKAIFKGKNIDQNQWKLLVDSITLYEPKYWHIIVSQNGDYAPFILNGCLVLK